MSSTQGQPFSTGLPTSNALISKALSSSSMVGFNIMQTQLDNSSSNAPLTNWQGGSGQLHSLNEVSVEDFILNETNLYVLVTKNRAIWVGTAQDLIEDSASRAQFRHSTKFATAAYEMPIPKDEADKIKVHADLLSGHPLTKLHAA